MLIFSSLGLWAIREGRRESNGVVLVLGFVLAVYSYFTPQTWLLWLLGTALTVAVFMFRE